MHDDLGDHGVEGRAGPVAGEARTVHTHARTAGRFVAGDDPTTARDRAVSSDPLEIDTQLDGVSARRRRTVGQADIGERFAPGKPDLDLHQVEAGHGFGDGVLHLQTGVGLDEHRGLAVGDFEQELESRQAPQARRLGHAHRPGLQPRPQGGRQSDRRGELDHLLPPALQRAFTVVDRHRPHAVASYLHLDVPGCGDEALGIEPAVTEGGLSLLAAGRKGLRGVLARLEPAHAAPAAAGHGFDHQRRALGKSGLESPDVVQRRAAGQAVDDRNIVGDGKGAGASLVAEQVQSLGVGADEGESRRDTDPLEGRAFRQEAITRVDGVASRRHRGVGDGLTVEIGPRPDALQRQGGSSPHAVERRGVVLREHGDGMDAQVRRGAGDPDGNLTAVGDEQGTDRQARSPNY